MVYLPLTGNEPCRKCCINRGVDGNKDIYKWAMFIHIDMISRGHIRAISAVNAGIYTAWQTYTNLGFVYIHAKHTLTYICPSLIITSVVLAGSPGRFRAWTSAAGVPERPHRTWEPRADLHPPSAPGTLCWDGPHHHDFSITLTEPSSLQVSIHDGIYIYI